MPLSLSLSCEGSVPATISGFPSKPTPHEKSSGNYWWLPLKTHSSWKNKTKKNVHLPLHSPMPLPLSLVPEVLGGRDDGGEAIAAVPGGGPGEAEATRKAALAVMDSITEFRHLNFFQKKGSLSLDAFFRYLTDDDNTPCSLF